MAKEDIEAIIRKAMNDDVFRLALARNFDQTVRNFSLKLSDEEFKALSKIDWSEPLPTSLSKEDAAKATWVHIYKTSADI